MQRFLLVLLLILGLGYQNMISGTSISPTIDTLLQQVTELTYNNQYEKAQNIVLVHLKQEQLNPIERFYGHFLLADITKSSGNPRRAIPMLEKLKGNLDQVAEYKHLFESLIEGNISECYFNFHQHDQAFKYASSSIEISPDSSLRNGGHAVNNIIIGFYLAKHNNHSLAIKHYQKAIEEYLAHDEVCELPLCYIRIGRLYWESDNNPAALKMLNKAIYISDSCNITQYKLLSNMALFNYYKHQEQHQKALSLLDTINTLKGTINKIKQQKVVQDLEVKYQTELTQKENENLKIQQQNNQFKITALIISTLSLLLLLLLVFLTLKMRNRKNDLLKDQLQKIGNQNQERDALLKEIHHRVKNNLQVITSLLHLQANQEKTPEANQLVQKSQYRINAMAMIHEMLYQSDNLSKINLHDYLYELLQSIIISIKGANHQIQVDLKTPPIYLGLDTATPLGLLINEVVTNALIHGIKDNQKGNLYIHISPESKTKFNMRIGDDGVGCPQNIPFHKQDSLGLKLIKKLSRQLLGTAQIDPTKAGCHYIISFQEIDS